MPPYSRSVAASAYYKYVEVAHSDRKNEAVQVALSYSPVLRYPLAPIPEGVVRFEESDEIIPVPSKDTYLVEEKNLIWYSRKEISVIQQENRRLLRGYQRKTIDNATKDFCLRGLERQTVGGSQRVMANRLTSLYVVLEEQHRQYEHGIYDPELLANLTAATTYHCQKEAVMLGIDDAQQILDQEQVAALAKHENLAVCHVLLNPSKWFKQRSNQPIFTCL